MRTLSWKNAEPIAAFFRQIHNKKKRKGGPIVEKRKNLPARLCACLLALLLLAPAASADEVYPKALTTQEYQTLNLFLSNFTEVGVGEISPFSPDQVLVDFAHDHLWCNRHDDFEFGEYFDGYNCRVADTDIQSVIDDYFYDAPQVDLRQTRLAYRDGYYYHQETGGWSSGGFALSASACALGAGKWLVSFLVFGAGEFWDNNELGLSFAEAIDKYGAPCNQGAAVVYSTDLADRSTYKMVSYTLV